MQELRSGLTAGAREALEDVARRLLALRPLIDVLESPLRVAAGPVGADAPRDAGDPGEITALAGLLDHVAARLGTAARFELRPHASATDLGAFGRVLSEYLALGSRLAVLRGLPAGALCDVDALVDDVIAASFERFCSISRAVAPDGVPVRTYSAGDPRRATVVIAAACGMPAKLAEPWMRRLAGEYHVVTWETRGLFGDEAAAVRADGLAHDARAQAADLFAVLDRWGARRAHVMGMCGGAVIALTAAAQQPERISSLSLWHGDFDLGRGCPKTKHQRDLKALLDMATEGLVTPAALHRMLCDATLKSASPDLAHLVLYPYATPDLLFRYCKLNGSLMGTDVSGLLGAVTQPVLVVTSEDDATTHPSGSRSVAAALPDATLHVAPHGDHISLFHGEPELIQLASDFIARHAA